MVTNDPEKLNENQPEKKLGGARPGAGRPLHSKNPDTIKREEALRQFKERVANSANRLFNAQHTLAVGSTILLRVDKDEKGKKLPAVQVTSEEEMKQFVDELGGEDGEMNGSSYYFLVAQKPDNMAINSLLDRTFGRPDQAIKHTGDALNPIALLLEKYGLTESDKNDDSTPD